MSDYRPEQMGNVALVESVRRARDCGRVTDMPRDVSRLGGGMIRERSEARIPMAPKRRAPAPVAAPAYDFAAMEARLGKRIDGLSRGQAFNALLIIVFGIGAIAAGVFL